MRYFKCISWKGVMFTPGKIYEYRNDCFVANNGREARLSKWMKSKFKEVFVFSNYLKEVENP